MNYKDVVIRVPSYDPASGLRLEWERDYVIRVKQEDGLVILQANEAGLKSLAKHLITLANPEVPKYTHVHFDDSNSLEEGSCEFIIEKQ